ncbi:hypothetical protein INT47_008541 [Mucor saturninus]|uniref:Zinc phosphodiesterase ELAC protein 2 n=1 Tax=Mucor saturninus TaxID=64648 RepID=A0A8H7R8W9_9FUNG|nr:hypothetical protein INT47_008541 [Mucor saturninus]
MKAYIQILGQNSPEGPPSLIVHYDNQRYLFNCREGTQRLCVQEKARLAKTSNVFLSRLSWDCLGGLPGMLLTLTDAGIKHIGIHGGKNLAHFIASTRHFVYRTSTTVDLHEIDETCQPFTDKNLTVTPVIVHSKKHNKRNYQTYSSNSSGSESSYSSSSDSEKRLSKNVEMTVTEAQTYRRGVVSMMFTNTDKGQKAPGHTIEAECSPRPTVHPLSEEAAKAAVTATTITTTTTVAVEVKEKAGTRVVNNNQRNFLMKSLPKSKPDTSAITYICQGASVTPKFNKAAAMALGLKPGPVYGQLQKGLDVTLPDGRVITRDMVCDPEVPGHVFVIVDCPNTSYIDSLVNSDAFDKYLDPEGKSKINVMIHHLGNNVIHDERYKKWLQRFDTTTDHIFGSTDLCAQTVQFTSHAIGQVKLNKLNESIFPIPHYSNKPALDLSTVQGIPKNSYALKNMTSYNLEPRNGIAHLDRPDFNHTNLDLAEIKEIDENHEYTHAVKLARIEATKVDTSEDFPGKDVEVITLGTGSSIPAKYRNVSATLVKIPGYGSIMLDAGEGTYGQMMRRYGPNVDKEMSDIRCIFVSHLHADHHLGVIQLLRKWNMANRRNDTITVVAPFVYKHWLHEYRHVEYIGSHSRINFIRNENLLSRTEPRGYELKHLNELKKALGLESIEPVEVIHCRWAYGLSIKHQSGWKLVYSGDTRPCDKLVEAGQDATLLIHEATLEDASLDKAIAKRHTTTGEAIQVGKRMNARFTLLNHFSQRYPKLPVLSEEQSNVCFSFDMMSIPISQMPLLPKYTNAIQLAFKEEEDDG